MDEVKERCLPGTALPYTEQGVEAFSKIDALISVTGGLSLSQVCAITGLEGSTIQNWVKRGWVSNPRGKKYTERQLARIVIINALKDCIKLESIAQLIRYISEPDSDGRSVGEREVFNYLCQALRTIGRSDDLPGGSVVSVVDELTVQHEERTRVRLRRALSVMIYACVCSDVKRRTEAMLAEILPTGGDELDAGPGADNVEAETEDSADDPVDDPVDDPEPEEAEAAPAAERERVSIRPWFLRRG